MSVPEAELYAALAEVLAEPPEWLALPGQEWPLFELAASLLPGSSAALGLSSLPAEPLAARQARYAALFANAGRPRFWLHESGYLSGRILGAETFAVARFYRAANLTVNGAELPDHAAVELAFLAHLAETGQSQTEQLFLEQHALRWLPALGRDLATGGDPLYIAIGQLLADYLETRLATSPAPAMTQSAPKHPALNTPAACNLCGFCAQRCPTHALFIQETAVTTSLVLLAEKCTGCNRCVAVCQDKLLALASAPVNPTAVLNASERVACRICGAPTVSRAEFNYMVQKIGQPAWLETCLDCRATVSHEG